MVHKRLTLDDFQEQIVQVHDEITGVTGFLVVHSTALGPAIGGCRVGTFASQREMLKEGIGLARKATYKNALADIPFGGAKAVLQVPNATTSPQSVQNAIAKALAVAADCCHPSAFKVNDKVPRFNFKYLGGSFHNTEHATATPAVATAWTVAESMKVAVDQAFGSDLKGVRVGVHGLSSVGLALCGLLSGEGAQLLVADSDPGAIAYAAETFGAKITRPEMFLQSEVDVLSPCAPQSKIECEAINSIKAKVICGSLSNTLPQPDSGDHLRQLGILYAPDFVINAGGAISVAGRYLDETLATTLSRMRKVPARLKTILSRARAEGATPESVAVSMAMQRMNAKWSVVA